MVERFNSTLANMLTASVDEHHWNWDCILPYVLMAYRSAHHETTGCTPYRMMLGLEVTTPVDLMYEVPDYFNKIQQNKWEWELQERMEKLTTLLENTKLALQYLEAKIIPIIAKVIAFIDTNRNLDILVRHEPHAWQIQLFQEILNLPNLFQLNFTDTFSSTMTKYMQVAIRTTSQLGNTFYSYIPFSWIIYEQTELLLRKHLDEKDIKESQNEIIQTTVDVLKSLGIGSLVDRIDKDYNQQFIWDYIKDFVYMAHPVKSKSEHELIWQTIKAGFKGIGHEDNNDILTSICKCHVLFKLNGTRFKHLSLIVDVSPECCDEICEMKQKNQHFVLVTDNEMTLDVFALHILLRNIEPQKDILEEPQARMQWLRNVCDYRLIVERMFSHFRQSHTTNQNNYGDLCEKGMVAIRSWAQKADMKSLNTFRSVEDFLKRRNKAVLKDYFGQMAECLLCEKTIESAPVTLPCSTKHVLCNACFHQIVMFDFECPKCGTEFPEDFNPEETENRFSNKNQQIFMEVVSQMSFAEGSAPSTDVIEKVMSYVTGSGESKSAERVITKELTVFHDSFDPTPVVRSFLLQHMMLMRYIQ
ncbi:RNF213 [Mytilus edulis]|uniref:RNF213 n=1 Tax=Mytilus edulis TaxID=6550 RepID=A0A8S3S8V6_MYTED|nr:RNF213 [Mytilus edulis]